MERVDRITLQAMTKEELIELSENLQLRLEISEKEKQELRELAEIGKKYKEHLQAEAIRLTRLVEGENSFILKLIEKADIDTLKELVDSYQERAKEKFKASAVVTEPTEPQQLTKEWLEKANYQDLLKLSERLKNSERLKKEVI